MNYLAYYVLYSVIVVMIVMGFECYRLWKKKPSRQDQLDSVIHSDTGEFPPAVMPLQQHGTHNYSITWHHIAPEISKGHVLKIQGMLQPEISYELLIEPKQDLSLHVMGCQVQCGSMQFDPEQGCLLSLMPGMHALLVNDESGAFHLVCGGSNGFKYDAFEKNAEAQLVIENYAPKRQVSELRIHYKFAEPDPSFVSLAPIA